MYCLHLHFTEKETEAQALKSQWVAQPEFELRPFGSRAPAL